MAFHGERQIGTAFRGSDGDGPKVADRRLKGSLERDLIGDPNVIPEKLEEVPHVL